MNLELFTKMMDTLIAQQGCKRDNKFIDSDFLATMLIEEPGFMDEMIAEFFPGIQVTDDIESLLAVTLYSTDGDWWLESKSFAWAMREAVSEQFNRPLSQVEETAVNLLADLLTETSQSLTEARQLMVAGVNEMLHTTVCSSPPEVMAFFGYGEWKWRNPLAFAKWLEESIDTAMMVTDGEQMLVFERHPAMPSARGALLVAEAVGEILPVSV
jgi:hypothetical protein